MSASRRAMSRSGSASFLPTWILRGGVFCVLALGVFAEEGQGQASSWKGYSRSDFKVDGRACYLVAPKKPAPGNPWVWRATFPEYHPEADILLLEQGFHIAHMNTRGMLGSPRAMKHWDAFHEAMTTQHGLAKKVALEAVSRGGLSAYRWAARSPQSVACIYADVPVCDFKSWPLGRGRGVGSRSDWLNLLAQYGLTESEALAFRENPIDVLEPIAKAGIPLLHVVSLNDLIVPPQDNTFVLAKRYRALGGTIEIIEVKEGPRLQGHHFDHPDPRRVAEFIKAHARPGKKPDQK